MRAKAALLATASILATLTVAWRSKCRATRSVTDSTNCVNRPRPRPTTMMQWATRGFLSGGPSRPNGPPIGIRLIPAAWARTAALSASRGPLDSPQGSG